MASNSLLNFGQKIKIHELKNPWKETFLQSPNLIPRIKIISQKLKTFMCRVQWLGLIMGLNFIVDATLKWYVLVLGYSDLFCACICSHDFVDRDLLLAMKQLKQKFQVETKSILRKFYEHRKE